jgi:organic radical activating enzyme
LNQINQISALELPVMEHFYTLQGEGYHQGRPAYFIRLGGCDVGCVWCDVKESWDQDVHPKKSIHEIVANVKETISSGLIVITGGEPLMHPLDDLTSALKEAGYEINLETSGTHIVSGKWDWICLSPKKFKEPLQEILPIANELKIVVYHKSDFEWAEKFAAMVSPDCKLYLQPEWSKADIATPMIINYIKNNPQWTLSLQTHKFIQIP